MHECLHILGPLCWTVEWKFWLWLVAMIVIWAAVIINIYSGYQNRKAVNEMIARIKERSNNHVD